MSRFIPIDKMKKLRESARAGDVRAKKILDMQLGGEEDFSGLLEEYFAPAKPDKTVQPLESSNQALAEKSKLQQFLDFNGIKEDSPDYKEYVEDFYKENPNESREEIHHLHHKEQHEECEDKHGIDFLIKDEIEAINGYNRVIMEFMTNEDDQSEAVKKGIISDLEEIKRDEIEHLDKLRRIKASLVKKEENI